MKSHCLTQPSSMPPLAAVAIWSVIASDVGFQEVAWLISSSDVGREADFQCELNEGPERGR